MNGFSASIPVEQAKEVNERLAELGFGPDNFSIPVSVDGAAITHAGFHCFHVPGFREALDDLVKEYPDLVLTDDDDSNPIPFEKHKEAQKLQEPDFSKITSRAEKATAKKLGKDFVSEKDDNIWPVGTIGWKEVSKTVKDVKP